MALQKQPIAINFSQGLQTKSDPFQVPIGNFLSLKNSVFDALGRLTKRNGFPTLTKLPNANQTTLTTYNDNLIATGSNLYSYSQDTDQWVNQGKIQPVILDTLPLIRSSTSQVSPDSATADNGLVCLVYVDNSQAYYQITDSVTGQQVVSRQALSTSAKNARVNIVGNFFIITFEYTNSGTPNLAFIKIPTTNPSANVTVNQISAQLSTINEAYDVCVMFDTYYVAWNASDGSIKLKYMGTDFTLSSTTSIATTQASSICLCPDTTNRIIWLNWYLQGDTNGYTQAYAEILNGAIFGSPIQTISGVTQIQTMTAVADSGTMTLFYEVYNVYSGTSTQTDYLKSVSVDQVTEAVTQNGVILRSVGLASKAFISNDVTYMLVAYGETNQPTYFLIDSTGSVCMRLAYANGGGYATTQVLPNVTETASGFQVPYLIKDFLATVNKTTNSALPVNAIYTQTGVNLAKFSINTEQYSSSIAGALHLTGGQLWEFDAVKPVEHSFHVWPENITIATATGSGAIAAGTYFYVFCYEWTDNQGQLHRSAPSIPIKQITTTASSTNTIKVPTLRITDKISPNPVRIVGYRWSVAQQVYYQFTSLTSPTLNSTTVDTVTITDALADASILGTTLLYTTGGVIENIAAPASTHSTLFKNRLWLIDAEDQNLLWFSKQVIENTPVEMSDLLTLYVAPTTGAQGSTGPMKALSAMDDKLIMFKPNAIYYLTGLGPDNTGANNDFTDPTYITSSVGCSNPKSIVLMPNGIMFQSDKGIWLLGRDMSTTYIGAPVEEFNDLEVLSAQTIPGTNQVRFTMSNNVTLMYDYYYNQWGQFTNLQAISSTLYNSRHTYLNSAGLVLQETPDVYIDNASPVLMSFKTAWINVAGLQGFQRFYELYLLGVYKTPFKLDVKFAYDYNEGYTHNILMTPDNYAKPWGGEALWGSGGPWGGPGNALKLRAFPNQQKCESFQLTIQEVYDGSLGASPGEGLSLSGLNLIVGVKKGYRTNKSGQSFG